MMYCAHMDENELKWHKRYMKQAKDVATWSKGRRTKVGAIIVDTNKTPRNNGYNGFPRKVDESIISRHEKPAKYLYTEHAERNAIYQCAKNGIATDGCTMYVTLHPCSGCARGIIQSGIVRVVIPKLKKGSLPKEVEDYWNADFIAAAEMFEEAEVEVISI